MEVLSVNLIYFFKPDPTPGKTYKICTWNFHVQKTLQTHVVFAQFLVVVTSLDNLLQGCSNESDAVMLSREYYKFDLTRL
jgi:hypothetical protein